MPMMTRPKVQKICVDNNTKAGVYFTHNFDDFLLKVYVPTNCLNGAVNDYTYKAPFILVLEENAQTIEQAVAFAEESNLASIARRFDASVVFAHPTRGTWQEQTEDFYKAIIKEVRMHPLYSDGICEVHNFFTKQFDGYFIRGAKHRTMIYARGKAADYVATNLLCDITGEFLWGAGCISPACVTLEEVSVEPIISKKDIAVVSVCNSPKIEKFFDGCMHVRKTKERAFDVDFDAFVWQFKMWCGTLIKEKSLLSMHLVEEAGSITVETARDHKGKYANQKSHTIGYFAYYRDGSIKKDACNQERLPLVIGFHGGGDSALYFTYLTCWHELASRHNFLFVAIDDHLNVCATEVMSFLETLKTLYPIDEKRIYATGFSMGSGKTWDLYQQYPNVFAGLAPASALFPMRNNPFGMSIDDDINKNTPVPIFYTGGEKSPLPELPFQDESCLERIQYLQKTNNLANEASFSFNKKDEWQSEIWSIKGEKVCKFYDASRDSTLTVHYFASKDGIVRTALGSINNQEHEFRPHTADCAWQFLKNFTKE